MKHTLPITIAFAALFIISQLAGLALISMSTEEIREVDGQTIIVYANTTIGERPETTGYETLIFIVIGVTIGTLALLFLVKHKKVNWWKTWFFLAALITMSISIGVIIKPAPEIYAWLIAIGLAAWKIYKPNPIVHNTTEILMYAGIAVLLVPILDVTIMIILLLLVSIYDAYAVWKSKHMVKMAKFTSDTNLFPGLRIAYSNKAKGAPQPQSATTPKKKARTGVLGGGDIAFPLLFTGTVMASLIAQGIAKPAAIFTASIITITTAISLIALFIYAKKDKFYPAMPFITAGCIAGYLIVLLVT